MSVRTAIKIPLGKRPQYFHGQLLLENDFGDEQKFHVEARQRHNLSLHDWGVVRGLTVLRAGEKSVNLSPGAAVDPSGREILLDETSTVDLSAFGPNDEVNIGLEYEEDSAAKGAVQSRRIDYYAAVTLANAGEPGSRVVLATVALDGQGKVNPSAISYSRTKYVRLAAGSITAEQLHDDLRTGWLRLPFRPAPLVDIPEEEKELPPPFRVGATRTLTPDHENADMKDRGAGGTMAIPLPPSVTQVTRFRIAGSTNEGEIHLRLYAGGWDKEKNDHHRKMLLDVKITSEKSGASDDTRFLKTFDIKETKIDAELWTLCVWLRGTRRTSVSLIAVEFAY